MPTQTRFNLTDLALALWVCAWIAIGIAIGVQVNHLSALSSTVVSVGRAVHTVGTSLHALGGVPLVGGAIATGASAVQAAGASAVSSGVQTQASIHTLSVLLAIAVAVLPTVPVAVVYLPPRISRHREALAVRQALANPARRAELRDFLAEQALHNFGLRQLSQLGVHLTGPLTEEEQTVLAQAQLRRLQIDPGALQPPAHAPVRPDARL